MDINDLLKILIKDQNTPESDYVDESSALFDESSDQTNKSEQNQDDELPIESYDLPPAPWF